MPALLPTKIAGKIIWLGRVNDRGDTMRASPVKRIRANFSGVDGTEYAGQTRPSCSRVMAQHPRGTVIRNVRQFSIVAAEELAEIAARIGVGKLEPEWLGVTIVIQGIPDFSHIPPSSRLQTDQGTTLTVDMQNRPCVQPGREIEKSAPGHGAAFKPAAAGLRGVTAWTEREGVLSLGDTLTLHVPDQRSWQHVTG